MHTHTRTHRPWESLFCPSWPPVCRPAAPLLAARLISATLKIRSQSSFIVRLVVVVVVVRQCVIAWKQTALEPEVAELIGPRSRDLRHTLATTTSSFTRGALAGREGGGRSVGREGAWSLVRWSTIGARAMKGMPRAEFIESRSRKAKITFLTVHHLTRAQWRSVWNESNLRERLPAQMKSLLIAECFPSKPCSSVQTTLVHHATVLAHCNSASASCNSQTTSSLHDLVAIDLSINLERFFVSARV